MKLSHLGVFLLLGVAGSAVTAFADDPIPKPFPVSRFDKLAANSPFSPPTAVTAPTATPPPAPQPGFADKYTLASIMQQGDDFIATLNNKEASERIRVSKTRPDPSTGIKIASVAWGREITQTRVTLEKNQQFGEVGFDASASPMTSATSPGMVPGGITRPNLRPVPPVPGAIRPPPGVAPNRTLPGAAANNPNAIRRPGVIRGPGAQALPRPNQPGVNFTKAPPIPGHVGNDDDDDDNDE